MTQYILRRLLLTIPTVWIVTLVLFILLRATPGDPVLNEFGIEVEPAVYQARREELGLNDPIVIQYIDWTRRMFTGDFGRSIRARQPVMEEIKERLPATMELAGLAFLLSVLISVPLGTICAIYPHAWFARATTTITLAAIAIPSFFISTMLVFFFTYKWRVVETPRYIPFIEDPVTNLRNLVLPTIALAIGPIAVFTRFIRASVIEALGQDYIRTAKAKGLTDWTVVFHHAFRNAMIPSITLIGGSIALLWTGAFITERIFNWPGMGRLSINALLNRDYPVIQAVIFLIAISYCIGNLFVDLLYGVADPRISYVRRR